MNQIQKYKKKNILYVERNTDGTVGGSHFSLLFLIEGLNKELYIPLVAFYQDNYLIPRYENAGCKILMMKEAKQAKEKIINEAKDKAILESNRIIELARQNIQNEKTAAINELRQQVANLSVEIAEKLLREKLAGDKEKKDLILKLLDDIKLN